GSPLDVATLRQNQIFVALSFGQLDQTDRRRESLLVDLLPAGWEPAGIDLPHDWKAADLPRWRQNIVFADFSALRDDRYIAAFGLQGGSNRFAQAYVLRAVSPGSYILPGAQVEDM